MKKQGGLFDVRKGAYDSAEECELVGTYMLSLISKKYNKRDFGHYRNDGLGVAKNKSGPETEKIKKNIRKIFQENKLDSYSMQHEISQLFGRYPQLEQFEL